MNMIQPKEVAVFSTDIDFVSSIKGSAFSSSSSEQLFEYQVNSSIANTNTNTLQQSAVVIYDLDLVANDHNQIIEDILQLQHKSETKPLVLVGGEQTIEDTLKSEKIKPRIALTISKPISPNALQIRLNAILPKQAAASSLVGGTPSNKFKLIAACSLIGVCSALALALSFIGDDEQSPIQNGTNVAKVSTPLVTDNEAINQAAADQDIALNIDGLLERASIAKAEGKISSPSNDNALYYYDQVLELDSYDSEAYEGRKEILTSLRDSLPTLLSANELDDARHIVDTLISAEPFRDDNKQLISSFNEALAANIQSQSSTSDELAIVPTEVKPTGFTFAKEIAKSTPKKVVNPATKDISEPVAQPQPIAEPIAKAEVTPSPINDSQETKQPSVAVNPSANDTNKPFRQQVASIAIPSIEQPFLVKRIGAKYPKRAFERDIEGWTEVAFQIDEQGKVINAKITNAQPEGIFDKESLKAIKKWKFEPAKNNQTGKTVISSVKKTRFKFNLNFNT